MICMYVIGLQMIDILQQMISLHDRTPTTNIITNYESVSIIPKQ